MGRLTGREDELQAATEAAEWLDIFAQAQSVDRKGFAKWLARSPLHVQEFLTMTAIDRYLDYVPKDYPLDLSAIRASASAKVVPFAANVYRSAQNTRSRGLARMLTVAGGLLIAAVVAVSWCIHAMAWQRYATGIGEQRAFELQDGSIVYLNACSRLDIHLTQQARDVYLRQGEALFKVRHEAQRPFRVHAEDTLIQAVGTQFDVYRRDRETTVAVLEGAVRISTPTTAKGTGQRAPSPADAINAGEEVRVASTGQISVVSKVDQAKAVAWRQRRLVFDQTSLPEIVEEFNRYNREPQLRVEGEQAQRRRFTGAFDADDPESLAQLLAHDEALVVERAPGEILIRARPTGVVR